MSFYVSIDFTPEICGWHESNDGAAGGVLMSDEGSGEVFEVWRRGDSVLRLVWSSPVTISKWGLNGKLGADDPDEFVKAIT